MELPSKQEREEFEVEGFIEAYARLPENLKLTVMAKGEKPDYVVRCAATGQEFGVELTSVYLSNKSVQKNHIPSLSGAYEVVDHPFDPNELIAYKQRLLDAISTKVAKAIAGYDLSRPLILSIYANEYVSMYLNQVALEEWVDECAPFFDNIHPFSEVVIWSLPNDGVFSVRPS